MHAGSAITVAALTMSLAGTAAADTMRLGMGDPIDSDQGALATRFAELVAQYSDGAMEVQLFPGGQLGAETEMIQNSRLGTLDFALVGIGNVTPFAARLGGLTMPYAITSHEDAVRMTTGDLGLHWNTIAQEEAGLHIVAWTYSNFRFLTNSDRPVRTLEDLQGLRVRVPQNPIMLATYEAWGASPIAMAWPEVFTALQQGVVDGQDNPYIVNYTMNFHEVQDYLTEVHYNYSLQPLVMGVDSWNALSEEEQDILTRAGLEAQMYALLFQVEEANAARDAMIAAGVEVSSVEDEEAWIEIARTEVWPQFYDTIGGQEAFEEDMSQLSR